MIGRNNDWPTLAHSSDNWRWSDWLWLQENLCGVKEMVGEYVVAPCFMWCALGLSLGGDSQKLFRVSGLGSGSTVAPPQNYNTIPLSADITHINDNYIRQQWERSFSLRRYTALAFMPRIDNRYAMFPSLSIQFINLALFACQHCQFKVNLWYLTDTADIQPIDQTTIRRLYLVL